MFSKRDPVEEDEGENGRDVFNEKPSAEEVREQNYSSGFCARCFSQYERRLFGLGVASDHRLCVALLVWLLLMP